MKKFISILLVLLFVSTSVVSCSPEPKYTAEEWEERQQQEHKENEAIEEETSEIEVIAEEPSNDPPVADAGGDTKGFTEEMVFLDGSKSSDPNGDELYYVWMIGEKELSNEYFLEPYLCTFIAEEPGTYYVTLTVSDGKASDSDTVKVTIEVYENIDEEEWMWSIYYIQDDIKYMLIYFQEDTQDYAKGIISLTSYKEYV